jgi:alkylated DNA repair dioxygenase AlkB
MRNALQPDLFGASMRPRGLWYRPHFLGSADEAALLRTFAGLPFREATFRQYTARRRVVRFGHLFDPDQRAWVQGDPLPDWLAAVRRNVAQWRGVPEEVFIHALVTEYRPGTPIGWHRDKPEYGIVVGISLGASCRMRFRPCATPRDHGAVIALELAPRSLYLMEDDVRQAWQHSIPPVKALRYSITLRTRAPPAVVQRRGGTFRD